MTALAYNATSAGGVGNFITTATTSAGFAVNAQNPNCEVILAWGNSGGSNFSSCSPGFSSDARLKKDIAPVENGLSTIMALKPITYRWKRNGRNPELLTDKNKTAIQYGFIAQDVLKVMPDLVGEGPVHLNPEEMDGPTKGEAADTKSKPSANSLPSVGQPPGKEESRYFLDYQGFISPMVKAIQELKALFDGDHADIAKLKADNDNLKAANDNEAAQIKVLTARLDALEAARR